MVRVLKFTRKVNDLVAYPIPNHCTISIYYHRTESDTHSRSAEYDRTVSHRATGQADVRKSPLLVIDGYGHMQIMTYDQLAELGYEQEDSP